MGGGGAKLLSCLLCFVGVGFGAYGAACSAGSEASVGGRCVRGGCRAPVFVVPSVVALVRPLFFGARGRGHWYLLSPSDSSLGWPRFSDVCGSGAAAVAYWLGSTTSAEWVHWDDIGSEIKDGS